MKVKVNNKIIELEGDDIPALLDKLGLPEQRGVAVAVNERVIGKTEWNHFKLRKEDNILIIKPAPGG